jgi:hypothetical protein
MSSSFFFGGPIQLTFLMTKAAIFTNDSQFDVFARFATGMSKNIDAI